MFLGRPKKKKKKKRQKNQLRFHTKILGETFFFRYYSKNKSSFLVLGQESQNTEIQRRKRILKLQHREISKK